MTPTATRYAPDALLTLRDSFALHLDASRTSSTRRIYLNALDRLIRHLEAHGMPTAARSVKREHVESFIAARRATVKDTTLSVEFRALQQFFKWALEEDEIDRSPMERMKARATTSGATPRC
jgi:site-specific recombinase XerD